jgi:hypothetical protein
LLLPHQRLLRQLPAIKEFNRGFSAVGDKLVIHSFKTASPLFHQEIPFLIPAPTEPFEQRYFTHTASAKPHQISGFLFFIVHRLFTTASTVILGFAGLYFGNAFDTTKISRIDCQQLSSATSLALFVFYTTATRYFATAPS